MVPPDQTPEERRTNTAELAVLQFQVGALQTSIDRGLGALERAVDKGFEGVNNRQDKMEMRLRVIEDRQNIETARLNEVERRHKETERELTRQQEAREVRMAEALDDSQLWTVVKWLGGFLVAFITAAAAVAGIVSLL